MHVQPDCCFFFFLPLSLFLLGVVLFCRLDSTQLNSNVAVAVKCHILPGHCFRRSFSIEVLVPHRWRFHSNDDVSSKTARASSIPFNASSNDNNWMQRDNIHVYATGLPWSMPTTLRGERDIFLPVCISTFAQFKIKQFCVSERRISGSIARQANKRTNKQINKRNIHSSMCIIRSNAWQTANGLIILLSGITIA